MSVGFIGSVLIAIVGLAVVFTLVSHTETAQIITAGGTAFQQGLQAAMGR